MKPPFSCQVLSKAFCFLLNMSIVGQQVCLKQAVFSFLARMRRGLYYNMPLVSTHSLHYQSIMHLVSTHLVGLSNKFSFETSDCLFIGCIVWFRTETVFILVHFQLQQMF